MLTGQISTSFNHMAKHASEKLLHDHHDRPGHAIAGHTHRVSGGQRCILSSPSIVPIDRMITRSLDCTHLVENIDFLGKGQSARTCQPSLFFGSISKQHLSNAVVLALTFSYSPHYFYLVLPPSFVGFGSYSPHLSVLVPIALTFMILVQTALTFHFCFK